MEPISRKSDEIELLLVDDDRDLIDALTGFLKSKGLRVSSCHSCREASELLSREGERFQILLSDLRLPDGDGLRLIEIARLKNPNVLAALMTGYASLETALKAIQLGAYDYVTKPFSLSEIEILTRNMVDKIRLESNARRARDQAEEANAKLKEIYSRLDSIHEEKLELMKLNREMKREFETLSNKMDQIIQMLQVIFPQANRNRWPERSPQGTLDH